MAETRSLSIMFRPQESADETLVCRAHAAHRAEAFATIGLPSEMLESLCAQQHALLERHIAAHHPAADLRMIVVDGDTVGRLCLDRERPCWRIVDLVLVSEAQRRGIGTAVIALTLDEARHAGVGVDLHVGIDNAAAERLYRRFGFTDADSASETHRRLAWAPTAS